jgi:hypothetical protein
LFVSHYRNLLINFSRKPINHRNACQWMSPGDPDAAVERLRDGHGRVVVDNQVSLSVGLFVSERLERWRVGPAFGDVDAHHSRQGPQKVRYPNSWSTVKAPNFGPHGNFGLFLASSVASVDESCTKNEKNRTCRPNIFIKLLFSLFFCRTRFSDNKPFWKRGPKFPRSPKLGALTACIKYRRVGCPIADFRRVQGVSFRVGLRSPVGRCFIHVELEFLWIIPVFFFLFLNFQMSFIQPEFFTCSPIINPMVNSWSIDMKLTDFRFPMVLWNLRTPVLLSPLPISFGWNWIIAVLYIVVQMYPFSLQ